MQKTKEYQGEKYDFAKQRFSSDFDYLGRSNHADSTFLQVFCIFQLRL